VLVPILRVLSRNSRRCNGHVVDDSSPRLRRTLKHSRRFKWKENGWLPRGEDGSHDLAAYEIFVTNLDSPVQRQENVHACQITVIEPLP
jgi:hypothetical protein